MYRKSGSLINWYVVIQPGPTGHPHQALTPTLVLATLLWTVPLAAAPAGNMFSGPTTGDPGAVFFNPAALTLRPKTQVLVHGTFMLFQARYDRATPSAFDGQYYAAANTITPALLPAFALATDAGLKDWRFGLGVALPTTAGVRWDEEYGGKPASTRYHAMSANWIQLNIEPAVAYRISRYISVGFGLDIIGVWISRDGKIDYAAKINQLICMERKQVSCPLNSPLARENPAFDVLYEFDGLGFSVGVFGGVLITPVPWIRVGLSVHSGGGTVNVPASLQVRYPQTVKDYMRDNVPSVTLPPINATIDIERPAPVTISVGVEVELRERLTVAMDFYWKQTSAEPVQQITVLRTNTSVVNDQVFFNVKHDTYQWGLRTEYQLLEQLLGGFRVEFKPYTVPSEYVLPVSVDFHRLSLFAGLSWQARPWLTLVLEYAHHFNFTRTIHVSHYVPNSYPSTAVESALDRASPTGRYSVIADHLGLGAVFAF